MTDLDESEPEILVPTRADPGMMVGVNDEDAGSPELEELGRAAVDTLRLAVAPVSDGYGFEILVYVNDEEMTSAGAGLGMDPDDLLVPVNRLQATTAPVTVPIARCECGEYGCGSTDVTIVRDGASVHWDWSLEVPMDRGVTFAAAQYDAEVARVGADRSWETPERTAGRLVLTGVDRDRLTGRGLRIGSAANYYLDETKFVVSLMFGTYQVFVLTPWLDRTPEELAREVCATLLRPPQEWVATWHDTRSTGTPPEIAGPLWQPFERPGRNT